MPMCEIEKDNRFLGRACTNAICAGGKDLANLRRL